MSPIPEDPRPELVNPLDEMQPSDELDMKLALTELLNSSTVRKDAGLRSWVQAKLMEAELALKRQRRKKRTSVPTIVVTPTEDGDRRISL